MIHLLLGGARSGKSRRAVALAGKRSSVVFFATASPRDGEMRSRIAAHRRERPAGWRTIEESRSVPDRLAALAPGTTVILDCVTLWIARLMTDRIPDRAILTAVDRLVAVARFRRLRLIAVSNEVGSGVVPPTPAGRRFQDLLGAVNARLARTAGRVELLVAGVAVAVKGERR